MDFASVPEVLRGPLSRWWERAAGQPAFLEGYAALGGDLRAELPRAVAGSEFIAAVLIQDPAALKWFGRHEEPSSASMASPARAAHPTLAKGCVFQTVNGHYLTAVGGGGRITDVIHSDAPWLRGWEEFSLHYLGNGQYSIETINGHYLTAVGGGGRITNTIHSDATRVGSWEKFRITCSG